MNGEIVYASLVRSTGFEDNILSSKFIIQVPRARSGKFFNK